MTQGRLQLSLSGAIRNTAFFFGGDERRQGAGWKTSPRELLVGEHHVLFLWSGGPVIRSTWHVCRRDGWTTVLCPKISGMEE